MVTAQVSAETSADSIAKAERPQGRMGIPNRKGIPKDRKFEVMKFEVTKNEIRARIWCRLIWKMRFAVALTRFMSSGVQAPATKSDDWFTAEREVRQRYRQQTA